MCQPNCGAPLQGGRAIRKAAKTAQRSDHRVCRDSRSDSHVNRYVGSYVRMGGEEVLMHLECQLDIKRSFFSESDPGKDRYKNTRCDLTAANWRQEEKT